MYSHLILDAVLKFRHMCFYKHFLIQMKTPSLLKLGNILKSLNFTFIVARWLGCFVLKVLDWPIWGCLPFKKAKQCSYLGFFFLVCFLFLIVNGIWIWITESTLDFRHITAGWPVQMCAVYESCKYPETALSSSFPPPQPPRKQTRGSVFCPQPSDA